MPCSKYVGKQRNLCYATKGWTDFSRVKSYRKKDGTIVKMHTRSKTDGGQMIYRAKGRYRGESKETWITTVWRRNKKDAEDDIAVWGNLYTNPHIVSKEWEYEQNVR